MERAANVMAEAVGGTDMAVAKTVIMIEVTDYILHR
jgi:hypothetical protein